MEYQNDLSAPRLGNFPIWEPCCKLQTNFHTSSYTTHSDIHKTIGHGFKSLKLKVRGKVYIKEIKAVLVKTPAYRVHSQTNVHRTKEISPAEYSRQLAVPIERLLRILMNDTKNKGGNL